jgi:hypothetical protein
MTRPELFQRGVESLGAANVIGVVLNDVELAATPYAYAYQYYQKHYWVAASAPSRKTPLRVRPYCVARPRGVFVAGRTSAVYGGAAADGLVSGGTFEAPIVIALCGLFFHMKGLDKALVEAEPLPFFRDLFQALAFALGAAALLFYFVPALASRAEATLPGAFLAGVMPVMLRPMVQHLVRRKKLVEGILIVGAGELAEKLCRALGPSSTSARDQAWCAAFPRESGRLPKPPLI